MGRGFKWNAMETLRFFIPFIPEATDGERRGACKKCFYPGHHCNGICPGCEYYAPGQPGNLDGKMPRVELPKNYKLPPEFAGWTTPRTPQAAWKPVMYKAEQWYYLKGHNNFGDAGPYGGGPYSGVGPFPVAHPPGAPPPIPQAGGGHGGVPHFGGGHAPGSSVGGGTQLPGAGGDPYAPASVASSRRSGGGSTVSGGGGSSRGSERSATPIYRSDGRGDGGGRRRRGSRERMSRVDEDSE